jgi:hypothetical protein
VTNEQQFWLTVAALAVPTTVQVVTAAWSIRVAKFQVDPEKYPLPLSVVKGWYARHFAGVAYGSSLFGLAVGVWLVVDSYRNAPSPLGKATSLKLAFGCAVVACQIAILLVTKVTFPVLKVLSELTDLQGRHLEITRELTKLVPGTKPPKKKP